MANKIAEIVTQKIIDKLESGVIPWIKPWKDWKAINYVTRKQYQGINAIMLDRGGEYLTFLQIKKLEGKVKKGSKGNMIIFYKMFPTKDKNTKGQDVEKIIPLIRYSTVFHIDDTMGIKTKIPKIKNDFVPDEKAEKIVDTYINRENITVINKNVNRAFYRPFDDVINMPFKKQFKSTEEYYSTMFHEMAHSTGHKNRLNRLDTKDIASRGVEYSKEELTAEISSGMLCGMCNMFENTLENTAAYIKSWLQVLNDDKTFIITASSKAQKAVSMIIDKQV